MTDQTPEIASENPAMTLEDALVVFTGCIGSAFDDICSYGLTVGDSYVPFDPDEEDDCDDEEAFCSQVWVRVENGALSNVPDSWEGGCGGEYQLVLEVGILRCAVVPEKGEAPSASDTLVMALQSVKDMTTIQCAAMGCDEAGWSSIVAGTWQPMGPLGGQYGGAWTFTVTFS